MARTKTNDTQQSRGWKPVAWRIGRIVLLVYVGLLIVLYFIQTTLLFPGASSQSQANAKFEAPPDAELVDLSTASGVSTKALFGVAYAADGKKATDANKRPTLLFCYGNAMCLRDSKELFTRFRRLGMNVIIPEYAGYGMSGGTPSERGCYEAADAAYEHLLTRKEINPKRIIVCGWSLGGAVAIDVAQRKQPAGLAVFSTFTSVAEMGQHNYPFYPLAALRAILKSRFESEKKMRDIKCPVMIGHSKHDEMIPFAMADRLEKATGRTAKRLTLENVPHNDFFERGGAEVNGALTAFAAVLGADSAVKDALEMFNEPKKKEE